MQAFGAASVLSLGAGTVADLVEPKNRAAAMSIVLLGPQLGPVLGPLLGGALTGAVSWRWIFGFLGNLFLLLSDSLITSLFPSNQLNPYLSHVSSFLLPRLWNLNIKSNYLRGNALRPRRRSSRNASLHCRQWRNLCRQGPLCSTEMAPRTCGRPEQVSETASADDNRPT